MNESFPTLTNYQSNRRSNEDSWPKILRLAYGTLHIIIILYNNAQYNNIRAYSLITPDYYIFWLVIDYIVALYLNTKGILRLYWQKLIQA